MSTWSNYLRSQDWVYEKIAWCVHAGQRLSGQRAVSTEIIFVFLLMAADKPQCRAKRTPNSEQRLSVGMEHSLWRPLLTSKSEINSARLADRRRGSHVLHKAVSSRRAPLPGRPRSMGDAGCTRALVSWSLAFWGRASCLRALMPN